MMKLVLLYGDRRFYHLKPFGSLLFTLLRGTEVHLERVSTDSVDKKKVFLRVLG